MTVVHRRPIAPRHTRRLCLRISPDIAERLDRAAEIHGLRLSEIGREALEHHLTRLETARQRAAR